MPKSPSAVTDFAKVATEMLALGQATTLSLLEFEMQGLAKLIPGADAAAVDPLPTEEEVEQGFENMPV